MKNSFQVNLIDDKTQQHKILILVWFRGLWCGFCKKYLKMFQEKYPEIVAQKGEIVGITSQKSEFIETIKEKWNISFPLISDNKNSVAKAFKEREIIKLFNTADFKRELHEHRFVNKKHYPHGMIEPGIVIFKDGKVVYTWVQDPDNIHEFGLENRPKPDKILSKL